MNDEKQIKQEKNNEIQPLTPDELARIRGGQVDGRRRPRVVSDPHRWPR